MTSLFGYSTDKASIFLRIVIPHVETSCIRLSLLILCGLEEIQHNVAWRKYNITLVLTRPDENVKDGVYLVARQL